ncbi:hypothetical protein BGZ79_003005 [Entomortierella chlamydospora]|nr:hypothetical protein BGZ79_003005 [Entomortierella chlamydospora]
MSGEMTGVDSTMCRNSKLHAKIEIPQELKKKMGIRAEFIWRSINTPEKDWSIGEAARQWDELSSKYTDEANFKILRQLHDILMSHTMEVGGPSKLRNVLVSGLILGDTASTIDLMDKYEITYKKSNEEKRQERLQELALEDNNDERWRDLLASSP